MKLSKIKDVCKETGRVVVVDTYSAINMIDQWIGTNGAMYPVEGVHLKVCQMPTLWDVDEDKIEPVLMPINKTWREMLENAPSQIDEAGGERELFELGEMVVISWGDDDMLCIRKSHLGPLSDGNRRYVVETNSAGAQSDNIVLAYVNGRLQAALAPWTIQGDIVREMQTRRMLYTMDKDGLTAD